MAASLSVKKLDLCIIWSCPHSGCWCEYCPGDDLDQRKHSTRGVPVTPPRKLGAPRCVRGAAWRYFSSQPTAAEGVHPLPISVLVTGEHTLPWQPQLPVKTRTAWWCGGPSASCPSSQLTCWGWPAPQAPSSSRGGKERGHWALLLLTWNLFVASK